jgi:competence transcription factor ComK
MTEDITTPVITLPRPAPVSLPFKAQSILNRAYHLFALSLGDHIGKKRNITRSLDLPRHFTLMFGAVTGNSPRYYFPALCEEIPENIHPFVVDLYIGVHTEATDLTAGEELSAAGPGAAGALPPGSITS